MSTSKLSKIRVHLSPHFKFSIILMALGLSILAAAHSSASRSSDKSQVTAVSVAQECYYQPGSTNRQNSPATQTNNLNPAIWSDDDDILTLEESEDNLKAAPQTTRSGAVTATELLPSLFSKASQFHPPHIYLITACLRI